MPNFWRSVWTSVKVKSQNYFYFTIFLLKSTPCWLTFAKQLHHWGQTTIHIFSSHYIWKNNRNFQFSLHMIKKILWDWPVCMYIWKISKIFQTVCKTEGQEGSLHKARGYENFCNRLYWKFVQNLSVQTVGFSLARPGSSFNGMMMYVQRSHTTYSPKCYQFTMLFYKIET